MDSVAVCFLFLSVLLLSSAQAEPVRSLGCMVPVGNERDINLQRMRGAESGKAEVLAEDRGPFKHLEADHTHMTVQVCVEGCWVQRFAHAALQDGTKCFCAHNINGMVPVDTSLCHQPCSGNCKQRCGGRIALSAYDTGFVQEPVIANADVTRGLLGCYKEESWVDWCGAPILSESKENQGPHQWHHAVPLNDIADSIIMASYKPPLVSGRMSPLLCASYCITGPKGLPVAVLRSRDTCCCGRTLDRQRAEMRRKVDFSMFCHAPCADTNSRPFCVGSWGGERYISVYNTLAIWPEVGMRPRTHGPNGVWMKPEFPPNEKFEVLGFKSEWTPPEQGEQAGVELMLADDPQVPPVVGPDNDKAYVDVIDEPEEDKNGGGWLWVIVLILLICLLIFLTILCILFYLRHRTSEEEEDEEEKQRFPLDDEGGPKIDEMKEISEYPKERAFSD